MYYMIQQYYCYSASMWTEISSNYSTNYENHFPTDYQFLYLKLPYDPVSISPNFLNPTFWVFRISTIMLVILTIKIKLVVIIIIKRQNFIFNFNFIFITTDLLLFISFIIDFINSFYLIDFISFIFLIDFIIHINLASKLNLALYCFRMDFVVIIIIIMSIMITIIPVIFIYSLMETEFIYFLRFWKNCFH